MFTHGIFPIIVHSERRNFIDSYYFSVFTICQLPHIHIIITYIVGLLFIINDNRYIFYTIDGVRRWT